ncbi:hypothetical protein P691DRAFT_794417 [Macrolepiota fuliginosa MF-IS2]|uniref:Uncharacterized protein n=1 Tax=Macrolepiota fuliginosa MF-IS2 TaxID=1400762 RepID=A0A9P6C0F3_9AGAR|nr:hypothetical protein P691DRAFT_794417 [Macrolepiota fuliginosa MF-IS2]
MPFEMDLCNLLQTMKIESPSRDAARYADSVLATRISFAGLNGQDDPMDEMTYHSDGASDYSSSSSSSRNANITTISSGTPNLPIAGTANPIPALRNGSCGCAYLQAIREQFDNSPTTNVEYLDAIFTHREILNSFPVAHRDCARAFTDLAYLMEQGAWGAGKQVNTDAVTAFRHEAWMIASTL